MVGTLSFSDSSWRAYFAVRCVGHTEPHSDLKVQTGLEVNSTGTVLTIERQAYCNAESPHIRNRDDRLCEM